MESSIKMIYLLSLFHRFCSDYTRNHLFFFFLILNLYYAAVGNAQEFPWDAPVSQYPTIRLYAEFDQVGAVSGSQVVLIIRGFFESGWHIYSVEPQEHGPKPTTITYFSAVFQSVGKLEENPPRIVEDKALGMSLAVHENEFVFKQKFLIAPDIPEGDYDLQGQLNYQVCDNNICAPLQHQSFVAPLRIKPKSSKQR